MLPGLQSKREARLQQLRVPVQQRLASETPEDREARLQQHRETHMQQRHPAAFEFPLLQQPGVHSKLVSLMVSKCITYRSNCEVKEGKYSSDLEVVVRKSSEPRQSYSKFEVSPTMFDETDDSMAIDRIPRLVNYQRVSVKVKGIGEEDATVVKKGLIKHDYIIADRTGSCKIVTWEDNVGLLQVGNCYEFSGLMIRAFKGAKYHSIPKMILQSKM